jgi:hypothetical protein
MATSLPHGNFEFKYAKPALPLQEEIRVQHHFLSRHRLDALAKAPAAEKLVHPGVGQHRD